MARATRTPHRTVLVGLAVVVATAGALSACSGDDQDGAADAVGELAAGLRSGDLGDVAFEGSSVDEVNEAYGATIAPMGDLAREVKSADVVVDGDTATASLAWTWGEGASSWTYETSVELRNGDDWSIVWTPEVVEPSLADGDTIAASALDPERGEILAGDGRAIVTARDVIVYGIDKARPEAADEATLRSSAQALAEALDIDATAYVDRVLAAGDRAFVEALVVRAEQADENLLSGTPGVAAYPQQRPLAPTRGFAAPILGSVGAATAEIIEESDGEIAEGDVVGLGGLQKRYDEQLQGAPGLLVVASRADGTREELHRVEPTAGTALATTLSIDLQALAENGLANVEPASAIVAIRPSDGAILAAASGPGSGGQNTATFGQYAPGSTFKLVTALALLRAGLTPDSTLSCPATITVDGREFKNYSDYPASAVGEITLTQAVANSCNTAFIGAADQLGDGALAEAAAALGLGVDQERGFPAYFGQVPDPDSQTEAAASLIGQGRVLASPLAMASVAASIAAGATTVPTLLPDTDVPEPTAPTTPLTAEEAASLQGLMRAVVTEGSGSGLADVPGEPVGAKTGTAEYGTESPPLTHAWMVAVQGDLAVAVFVETGVSGSQTAGPILRGFLEGAASGG